MLRLNTRGGTELSANRLGCERLLLSLLSCLLGHGVLEAELSFKPGAQEILLPLGQGEFQLAHVDGDARVDILVALPGRINAYLNDGSGVFSESVEVLSLDGGFELDGLDFDQDGDTDLWISYSDGRVLLFENEGDHGFVPREAAAIRSGPIAIGDVDADGDVDVVVAINNPVSLPVNVPGAGYQLWINDGDGSFEQGPFLSTGPGQVRAAQLGDLDGDLDLDLLSIYEGEGALVWSNDGEGNFEALGEWLPEPDGGDFSSVLLGDFDNDTDLDLMASHSGGQNLFWSNPGDGAFAGESEIIGSYQPLNRAGDLDNDLDTDLVSSGAGCDECPNVWLSSDGTLQTSDIRIFDENSMLHQLELADVDGDGDLDVIALLDIIEAPAGRTVVSTWLNGLIDLSQEPSGLLGIPDQTLAFVIRQRLGLPLDLAVVPDFSGFNQLRITRDEFGESFSPIQNLAGLESANELEVLELESVLDLESVDGVLDLSFLESLSNLKVLRLTGNGITKLLFPESWTELQELHLDHNALTDLSFVEEWERLQVLSLGGNQLPSFELDRTLPSLRELDISANPLNAARIPSTVSVLRPTTDVLKNSGTLILGGHEIRPLPPTLGGSRSFEFSGDAGVYAIRRSVDLRNWEIFRELTIEPGSTSPVVVVDEDLGLGPAVFYSVIRAGSLP